MTARPSHATPERHQVPVRWCPAHQSVALFPGAARCLDAASAHLAKPCPLTPPLFYETPEGDNR